MPAKFVFYILFYLIVFAYGITVGSFLNVCIYRLPRNESLIKRNSHCTSCNEKIKAYDLIPLFSWIFLRGKCRNCGEKISPRYPLVEALNGIAYIFAFVAVGLTPDTIDLKLLGSGIVLGIFFSLLIVIGFIDYDTYDIYLSTLILVALLAIPSYIFNSELGIVERLIGGLCISVPFFIIGEIVGLFMKKKHGEKIRGIELGDTLLMAASGLVLGVKPILVATMIGIFSAAIVGLIQKYKTGESKLAFGPYLAGGLFIAAIAGNQIMDWYSSFLTSTNV